MHTTVSKRSRLKIAVVGIVTTLVGVAPFACGRALESKSTPISNPSEVIARSGNSAYPSAPVIVSTHPGMSSASPPDGKSATPTKSAEILPPPAPPKASASLAKSASATWLCKKKRCREDQICCFDEGEHCVDRDDDDHFCPFAARQECDPKTNAPCKAPVKCKSVKMSPSISMYICDDGN